MTKGKKRDITENISRAKDLLGKLDPTEDGFMLVTKATVAEGEDGETIECCISIANLDSEYLCGIIEQIIDALPEVGMLLALNFINRMKERTEREMLDKAMRNTEQHGTEY